MKKRNVFLQSLMAIQKITIEEFLLLAKTNLVLDVRSPSEYIHAHIPSAKSLPLFNDDERKIVGTAYKQESKQTAIKLGLDFFGKKMREMVEGVESLVKSYGSGITGSSNASTETNIKRINTTNPQPSTPQPITVLLHCWRGGMRSAGVAWLLDLYGFKVYTLVGGYKAYRNWVLKQFEQQYHCKIIGGYTGSGKTLLLHALAKEKKAIIDLEALANHKGSALGALGQAKQPTQEMFENLLAKELSQKNNESSKSSEPTLNHELSTLNLQASTFNPIWMEDESQRIGNIKIPDTLWKTMRSSKIYFFDIPFEERLNYLTAEYGVHKKDELVTAIMRIQKRLGGLETKNAINFLLENNFKECFRILLAYYDKYYLKGLYNRENAKELIHSIVAEKVNANQNINLLKTNL
jgi:tRNA 2-selenouridine synthase